jgi:uncharacterized protein YceK
VLSRVRADASLPVRADPEPSLRRTFDLPIATRFALTGTAHLATGAPDELLDAVVGSVEPGTVVSSTERLQGSPASRASAALDGDRATWWSTPIQGVVGQRWTRRAPTAHAITALAFDVVVDDQHSLPTELEITVDGAARTFAVPPLAPSPEPGATARVVFTPEQPLVGRDLSVTVRDIVPRTAVDVAGNPIVLPVALAEIDDGSPPVRVTTRVDGACRDDLVSIDRVPIPVRVTGDAGRDGRAGLRVEQCDTTPIPLTAGRHDLRTAPGLDTGIDLDRLVLASPDFAAADAPAAGPHLRRATGRHATVDGTGGPFWVRLDQSANSGWSARAEHAGRARDLGAARPVDFFASGWLVTQGTDGRVDLAFRWDPQRSVDAALVISALGIAACAVLVFARRRHERDRYGGRLAIPYAPSHLLPARRAPVAVSVLVVVLGALCASLGVALALLAYTVAAALGTRWRPLGLVARVTPVAALGCAVGVVVVRQMSREYLHDALWPTHFRAAHLLTLFAFLALLHQVWSDRPDDLRAGDVSPDDPAGSRRERAPRSHPAPSPPT